LLQALNRTGQLDMATICGISARMTMVGGKIVHEAPDWSG